MPECRAAIALERALVDLKAGKQTPDKVRSLLRGIERKDVERKKATSDAVFLFYRTEAKIGWWIKARC